MIHIRSKLSLERSKLEAIFQEYEKPELLERALKEENYEINREHKSI
jgi:hypothetical protein